MNLQAMANVFYVLFPRGGQNLVTKMLHEHQLEVTQSFETVVFFQASLAEFYRFLLHCPMASRMGKVIAFRNDLAKDLTAEQRLAILDDMLNATDWPTQLPTCAVQVKVKASYGLNIHEQLTQKRVKQRVMPAYLQDEQSLEQASSLRVTMGDEYIWYALEAATGVLYPRLSPSRARAAVKENLAALIAAQTIDDLQLNALDQEISLVLDPLCGSATLLLETVASCAQVARPEPRGLCLETWPDHNEQVWQEALEAHEVQKPYKDAPLKAVGFDASSEAIKASYHNIRAFSQWSAQAKSIKIHIERRDLVQQWPVQVQGRTLIMMNPPYGNRIGAGTNLAYFYQALGERLQAHANEIVAAGGPEPLYSIIASNIELLDCLRLDYRSQSTLFNGPDQIFRRTGSIAPKQRPTRAPLQPDLSQLDLHCKNPLFVQDLAQRLSKNSKKMAKMLAEPAPRSGRGLPVSVLESVGLKSWPMDENRAPLRLYRLYNADLPEYNCAIDIYEHCVYLQEYKAPATVDAQKAAHRMAQVKHTLATVLQMPVQRILTQSRKRQLGKTQYQRLQKLKQNKVSDEHRPGPLDDWHRLKHVFTMQEWGAKFIVNLGDYIDTGLFLDHRRLRWLIRHIAAHKHVLNLFSYTGSMSVHAALGGAASTTSVDLSPRYTAWAEHNFMANGIGLERHKAIRADVVSWLASHSSQYDLILIDPPTFSNSKKADDFLVQEHHATLIRQAMKHLQGQGHLIFSCNMKKFELAASLQDEFKVHEISNWTQSPDFQGKTGPSQFGGHRCWIFCRE